MSQVKGYGNSESEAKQDAARKATEACGGEWEQEGDWSCNEVSPGFWECDLWFHCVKESRGKT